jgi:drug/metabolite transporter (DMT)-like permease
MGRALVYTLWGATYLGNKMALASLPPMACTAGRFLIAARLLFAIPAVRRPARLTPPREELRGVLVTGTLLVGASRTLLSIGQRHIDSGWASLIVAAVPLWVLLMRTLSGQPTRPTLGDGVFGGLAGLALLLVQPGALLNIRGALTVLPSSVVWAAGSSLSQRPRLPPDGLVSPAWHMIIGGLAVGVVSGLSGEFGDRRPQPVTTRSWAAWGYLVLLCTFVGFTAYVWLLRHASLQLAATYAYANPVVAVVLGMIALDERLTSWQLPAAALIRVSAALVVSAERPPRRWRGVPAPPGGPPR